MSWHPGTTTRTPTFLNDLHGSNKRVDFMSELPLDIVMYNLVPRILSERPRPFRLDIPNNYLDVCRTWCQRILMASGSMRCSIRSMFLISKYQERLLDVAGPYVRRLDIAAISDKSINQLADTVMFFSLSELTISINGSQRAYRHFFATLPNLTYLKITYDRLLNEPFQVYNILDQCTRLTRLDLTLGTNTTMAISSDNQHLMYHNLVHLQAIRKNRRSNDMFIPLLRHLPNLRKLQLSYPPSETAMHEIHQHYPELQQLILGQSHARANTDIVQQQQQQQGLRLLRIRHTSFEGDYLPKLIKQYHSTLESIVFHANSANPVSSFNEDRDQDAFELKQLQSFEFESRRPCDSTPFIDWVINHAPNLESVKLLLFGTQHTHNLRTLMHQSLRRIELTCEPLHQPDHSRYLQHHIQLGKESHLKEIKCYISLYFVNGSWMYLIPKLNHLRSLELDFQFDKILDHNTFMMELSRGCAALESITIISKRFNSHTWIHPLTLHRNLRKLVIHGSRLSNTMLIELEDFHHLDCLHLKLYTFQWNSIARTRRAVPHLKCTQLPE
ncbi:hypothetical protein LRAMOSA04045 [Lichtheimia ramosa]|uniref:F-box domain-containing protein n=1 Tax=Lichtheimia ramosa TaxID=688394 RepID=A0A077WY83_9FUNG|nr:hypothetical protein LRAMOSA04045 [Lichtheimia ramosa]